MSYKIPDDVRAFRKKVPILHFYLFRADRGFKKRVISCNVTTFTTFDDAVHAGEKYQQEFPDCWVWVYQKFLTYSQLVRICDGKYRAHSRMTILEFLEFQRTIKERAETC
jgi:hypothetical protein